ncbi:LAMI_0G08218g1_1 [Lachancea mirantina]|uniref:LAMI_0G08218g1_1 n=1 Tax=Lachancea mirantina TaxID=1230905 RepID=A0A1G4K9V9_9SACH|nr:LAMI_0G08218g1_1 [Lachancea mirantina]
MLSMLSVFVWLTALLVRLAVADVAISAPSSGAVFSASGSTVSVQVKWTDDGNTPTLPKVQKYSILLCSGTNASPKCYSNTPLAYEEKASDFGSGSQYSFTASIDSSSYGNGQYFLQVVAIAEDFGYTIHYSPRFQLAGMAGASSITYSTNTQPNAQTSVTTGEGQGGTIDSRSFTVPYTEQTGVSRFAPVQTQPAASVTATTWTRRFPTSAVTYFSTYAKNANIKTTITPGWTYVITSDVNYASPAPNPSDNGGWYNPKSRQSLSTRKINAGKITVSS